MNGVKTTVKPELLDESIKSTPSDQLAKDELGDPLDASLSAAEIGSEVKPPEDPSNGGGRPGKGSMFDFLDKAARLSGATTPPSIIAPKPAEPAKEAEEESVESDAGDEVVAEVDEAGGPGGGGGEAPAGGGDAGGDDPSLSKAETSDGPADPAGDGGGGALELSAGPAGGDSAAGGGASEAAGGDADTTGGDADITGGDADTTGGDEAGAGGGDAEAAGGDSEGGEGGGKKAAAGGVDGPEIAGGEAADGADAGEVEAGGGAAGGAVEGEGGGEEEAEGDGEESMEVASGDANISEADAGGAGGDEVIVPELVDASVGPSTLDEEAEDQLEEATGKPAEAQLAQIKAAVDGAMADVRMAVGSITSAADAAQGSANDAAAAALAAVLGAAATTTAVVGSARDGAVGRIDAAALAAMAAIQAAMASAKEAVRVAERTQLKKLDKAVAGAHAKIEAAGAEAAKTFGASLKTHAESVTTAGNDVIRDGKKFFEEAAAKAKSEALTKAKSDTGGAMELRSRGMVAAEFSPVYAGRVKASVDKSAQTIAGSKPAGETAIQAAAGLSDAAKGVAGPTPREALDGTAAATRGMVAKSGSAARRTIDKQGNDALAAVATVRAGLIGNALAMSDQVLTATVQVQDGSAGVIEGARQEVSAGIASAASDMAAAQAGYSEQLAGLADGAGDSPVADSLVPQVDALRAGIAGMAAQQLISVRQKGDDADTTLRALGDERVMLLDQIQSEFVVGADSLGGQAEAMLAAIAGAMAVGASEQATKAEGEITAMVTGVADEAGKTASGMPSALKRSLKPILDQVGLVTSAAIEQLKGMLKDIEAQLAKAAKGHADAETAKIGKKIKMLWDAMEGMGTTESEIHEALRGIDAIQAAAVKHDYADHYGGTSYMQNIVQRNGGGDVLTAHLNDELSGNDLTEALGHLSGNKALAAKESLRNSVRGIGTNEEALFKQLRSLDAETLKQLREDPEFAALLKEVEGDLSGKDLKMAQILLDPTLDDKSRNLKADALELHDAMKGGWFFGAGTDEDKIVSTMTESKDRCKNDVLKFIMTEEEWEAEEERAQKESMVILQKQYTGVSGGSSLRDDLKDEISAGKETFGDATQEIAIGILDTDANMEKAGRLQKAAQYGGTDEKTIFSTLKDDKLVAPTPFDEPEPDGSDPKALLVWNQKKAEYEAKKKKYDKARADRDDLEAKYKKLYNRSISEMIDEEFATLDPGDRNGKDLAKTYLKGINEGEEANLAAKELNYAMEGDGTDEEMVKAALQGKSKAEVKKIKEEYKKKTGRELESDVASDMGGLDHHEVKKAMLGAPETPEDYAKLLEMDRQYQRGAAGSGFMDLMGVTGYYGAAEQFDHQHNRTKAALDAWSDSGEIDKATGKKGPVKKEGKAFETFQKQQGYFNDDFDSYEKSKNSVADALADGITIVGGALATALSGGAALPFILAGVGLLAAGTKMAIKGNSYDLVENGLVDLGKIGIDIITAGWGDKFLPAFKWGAKGVSLAEPVMAKGFTETMKQMSKEYLKKTFVDGLGKNVFKMVAETAMDAESWENDKFFSTLGGKALSHVDPRKFMAEKLVGDNVKKWTGAENTTSIIGTGFKSTVVNLSQGLAEDAMKVESYSDFGNEAWMKEKGKSVTTDMLNETAKANARAKNLAYDIAATDVKTDKDATKLANKLVADAEHMTAKEKTKVFEQLKAQNKEHMVPEDWKGAKSDEVKVKDPKENTKGKAGGVYAAPDQEVVKLNQMKAAELQQKLGLDEAKAKMIEQHLKENKITSVADLEVVKGIGPGTTKLIRQQLNAGRAVDPTLAKVNHVNDDVLRKAGLDDEKIKLIRDHIAKNGPIQSASDLASIKGIGKGTVATLTKAMSLERVERVTPKVLTSAGLTSEQSNAVMDHIQKVGPIKTADDLKKIKGLDDATRTKLAAALRV